MKCVSFPTVVTFFLYGTIFGAGAAQTTASCEGVFVRPAYKTRGYYCAAGQLVQDAYDYGKSIRCEEMEVDHLVSLRQAWDSGVCGDDLKRLANDPRNIKFTHWRTNRSKGYLQPESFAKTRAPEISEMIVRDAEAVMRAYRIKPDDQIVADRMLRYVTSGAGHTRVPISAVRKEVRGRIVYKQVGGKTIAFLGKRAIGYTLGAGLGVEVIMAAGWAVEWLTSPAQDDRMKERAVHLKAVLEGSK